MHPFLLRKNLVCLTPLVPLEVICEHKDLHASYRSKEEERGESPREGEIGFIVIERWGEVRDGMGN